MTSNNQPNTLIRRSIVLVDFAMLNFLVWLFADFHCAVSSWSWELKRVFLLCSNLSLDGLLSNIHYYCETARKRVAEDFTIPQMVALMDECYSACMNSK